MGQKGHWSDIGAGRYRNGILGLHKEPQTTYHGDDAELSTGKEGSCYGTLKTDGVRMEGSSSGLKWAEE